MKCKSLKKKRPMLYNVFFLHGIVCYVNRIDVIFGMTYIIGPLNMCIFFASIHYKLAILAKKVKGMSKSFE